MSDDNLAKAPGKILHIPTVAGAVVVTYNLPGNPALKLDAETIAGIFLGQDHEMERPEDRRDSTREQICLTRKS